MVTRLFTAHPSSVGESYGEHLAMALGFSWRLGLAALACLAHALLPFLFERTGSRIITGLHEDMVSNRRRRPLERPGPGSGRLAARR